MKKKIIKQIRSYIKSLISKLAILMLITFVIIGIMTTIYFVIINPEIDQYKQLKSCNISFWAMSDEYQIEKIDETHLNCCKNLIIKSTNGFKIEKACEGIIYDN